MNPLLDLPETSCPNPELSQTGPAREHLQQARHHLDLARDLLDRSTPEHRAAAGHIATCYQRALSAVTTWNCVRLPGGADVRELGRHAVHFASILQTPVSRALAVLPVLRAVGTKERLDVHDCEGVETGWYTARNLYRTAEGELPACLRTIHAAVDPSTVSVEPPEAGRRGEGRSTTYDWQEREPASAKRSAERAVPVQQAATL